MEAILQSTQLRTILKDLTEADARVREIAAQPESRLTKPPTKGGWSAIQCIDHLNITSRSYIALIADALASAKTLPRKTRQYRLDFIGWLLAKSLASRKSYTKSKTPPKFIPPSSLEIGPTLEDFHGLQSQLIQLLQAADGLSIDKIKISSLFNTKVRYSTYSAFRILAVHQMRHLDQAKAAMGS